jgi:HEAT repeat protein
MWLMRRHDPQLMEDGFGLLRDHAAEHVDELIAEFEREENDHRLRCCLLMLIGEARSERAFPLLAEQLHSSDESFRDWAVRGLEDLGTKAAREALYRARSNGEIT